MEVLLNCVCVKCCKNKSSYDMKIYFNSIKIILYLIKHIFIKSPFCWWHQINFHSIKTNLYSTKYIFIISPLSSWYQNIFSFTQNEFLFGKKYFYHMYLFYSSKIFFLYEFFIQYFSGEHIWSSICIYESQNFIFSM